MIKPKRLNPGDTVAVVSLSWGGLGDEAFIHKYYIAKKRLEDDFGLRVIAMPNALRGTAFVAEHPELRARDLMDAFKDSSVSAIFCAIGGSDTIRTLPYIDFDVIRDNPKIFMGYSDSTVNHFMMYKAGLVSFYGPSVMCEFGEYGKMFDYTKDAVKKLLFEDCAGYFIPSSPEWSDDFVAWGEENSAVIKKMRREEHGYELLQGAGRVRGHLIGGCFEVFTMLLGTKLWPPLDAWNGAILFLETSEEKPAPESLKWILRNLAAQGILKAVNGIIVGKPMDEAFFEEYKTAILEVVQGEEHLRTPILYNLNIGHAAPTGVLPYGIEAEFDCEAKTVTFLESPTI